MVFNLKKVINYTLFSLVFSLVVLPSGTILGFNVKMFFSLLLCILFLVLVLIKRRVICGKKMLFYVFLSVSFLLFMIGFSCLNPTFYSLFVKDEIKLFLSFFFVMCLFLFSLVTGVMSQQALLRFVVVASSFFSSLKIFFVLLILFGFYSYEELSNFVINTFDVKPMLMPIVGGLSRFQLANDYILAFLLFFMIAMKENYDFLSRWTYVLILSSLVLSVFISFSRYFFILELVAFLFYFSKNSSLSRNKLFVCFVLLSVFLLMLIFFWDTIYEVFNVRFMSVASAGSDSVRDIQKACLSAKFLESGFFGHGVGSFESMCPGPVNAPYSYEVQLYGLYYKLGFFGFALFVFSYLFPIFFFKSKSKSKSKNGSIIYSFVVLFWLMVGVYNPYLISSFSALIVLLIVINNNMSAEIKNRFSDLNSRYTC